MLSCGRFTLLAVPFALTVACGPATQPCFGTLCPDVQGRYVLDFSGNNTPINCNARLPSEPLELVRNGNELAASLEGLPLRGTLYESYDLVLRSTRPGGTVGGVVLPDAVSISGRYVPPFGNESAAQIVGTYTARYTVSGSPCQAARSFTAIRQ